MLENVIWLWSQCGSIETVDGDEGEVAPEPGDKFPLCDG